MMLLQLTCSLLSTDEAQVAFFSTESALLEVVMVSQIYHSWGIDKYKSSMPSRISSTDCEAVSLLRGSSKSMLPAETSLFWAQKEKRTSWWKDINNKEKGKTLSAVLQHIQAVWNIWLWLCVHTQWCVYFDQDIIATIYTDKVCIC